MTLLLENKRFYLNAIFKYTQNKKQAIITVIFIQYVQIHTHTYTHTQN